MQQSIQVTPNGRFLQRADGAPFFYLGDTAWQLFHRLTLAESTHYLTNRAAKGFTVIQAVALAELGGLDVPNANGDLPLLDSSTRVLLGCDQSNAKDGIGVGGTGV